MPGERKKGKKHQKKPAAPVSKQANFQVLMESLLAPMQSSDLPKVLTDRIVMRALDYAKDELPRIHNYDRVQRSREIKALMAQADAEMASYRSQSQKEFVEIIKGLKE